MKHSVLQLSNGRVTAAANTPLGDLGEESLYEIEPTAAGGSEVDMVPGMTDKPVPNFGDFVGSVVVHDQVDVQSFRQAIFNLVEES